MSSTHSSGALRLSKVAASLLLIVSCRAGSLAGAQQSSGVATTDPAAAQEASDPVASAPSPSPVASPAIQTPSSEPPMMATDVCQSAAGRRIAVTSAAELSMALSDARPLDVITLTDGTYQGSFVASAVGSVSQAIALCGSSNAILLGPSLTTGYTLHLQNAQYWSLVGFTVTGGAKGVMLDGANHNLLSHLTVRGIGSEGIHLRTNSSDNLVDGCTVSQTGTAGNPMFGEGIYIGSSQTNWCSLNAGQADRSDRNIVQHCTISQTTAENVDIKEGTTGSQLLANTLDGQGINAAAATSVVNVKGNSCVVQGNKLAHAPDDAISIHVILPGWGACNRFVGNSAADAMPGYGVHLAAPKPWPTTQVTADNLFAQAASGATNTSESSGVPDPNSCEPSILSVACSN